ncbi:hypothetical protein BD626DRAFT_492336 [Schizophyllum amplum]|uniref:Uncharacterized protein n=1 Tax=Schizophyllum amplum TaxID=97359 RepID=A0A550CIK1_9AGAR|nr:hypothetical protein BD626DRAFT_492336 [Auriculariopsis ampla]
MLPEREALPPTAQGAMFEKRDGEGGRLARRPKGTPSATAEEGRLTRRPRGTPSATAEEGRLARPPRGTPIARRSGALGATAGEGRSQRGR